MVQLDYGGIKMKESIIKPIKYGYLKEDLYSCWVDHNNNDYDCFVNKSVMDSIIDKIKRGFHIAFHKGCEFECYLEEEDEIWVASSNCNGIQYNSYWALENLENITDFYD